MAIRTSTRPWSPRSASLSHSWSGSGRATSRRCVSAAWGGRVAPAAAQVHSRCLICCAAPGRHRAGVCQRACRVQCCFAFEAARAAAVTAAAGCKLTVCTSCGWGGHAVHPPPHRSSSCRFMRSAAASQAGSCCSRTSGSTGSSGAHARGGEGSPGALSTTDSSSRRSCCFACCSCFTLAHLQLNTCAIA